MDTTPAKKKPIVVCGVELLLTMGQKGRCGDTLVHNGKTIVAMCTVCSASNFPGRHRPQCECAMCGLARVIRRWNLTPEQFARLSFATMTRAYPEGDAMSVIAAELERNNQIAAEIMSRIAPPAIH